MNRLRVSAALLVSLATPAWARILDVDPLWDGFLNPPADARPMMRWWWFGPAVEPTEIDREIRAMKAGGIGGFEVQPVYPLAPDGVPNGLRNLPYLSDPFLADLRHAAETARAEGLRIDVTGGSGWPFGGPNVPVTQASEEIRMERIPVPAGAADLLLPTVGPGEKLLSASLGPANSPSPRVKLPMDQARVPFPQSPQPREAWVFIAGRTGQQVKRAAVGAEGYVLDHANGAAVRGHLTAVGDRLLSTFSCMKPPYAIFSDSMEAYGSSWTDDLPAEFQRRRGYNLLDHLPALFLNMPDSAEVRFDWARTLSELVDERYLEQVNAWAAKHGTRFRAQVYGFPPTTLSSNRLVMLPEGEGADWQGFSTTRWATSAAHIYSKPIVSSEVWTWLHSPAWAATPLDMKVEADRHFLQGVNQLVGHGWPYSPPGVAEPGWSFYAAAALNDHNPWYGVMPDVMRYLQRVSYMLRQGEPVDRVAIYLPIEDVFAAMRPAAASVNAAMPDRVPAALIKAVYAAGQDFDFIDATAIRTRGIHYSIMVLPPMERIDPEAYAAMAGWVKGGGRIVAVRNLPASAGGLLDNAQRNAVEQLSKQLKSEKGVAIVDQVELADAISAAVPPDVHLGRPDPAIGFVHRHISNGDIYFVVNTGNTAVSTAARFAADRGNGSWWNPMTGRRWAAGTGEIPLKLAPYESRFLVFAGAPKHVQALARASSTLIANGWTLSVAGRTGPTAFRSWTDDPRLRYFSGTATYSYTLRNRPRPGRCVALDFGSASPLPITPPPGRPMAAITAPLRDAAIVYVNGVRVGSVWAPPYRLDITSALRRGPNRIEVRVSNTALNELAGRASPDYRLLNLRYGERFTPENVNRIAPQPSGLLQPVSLVEASQQAAPCGSSSE